MSGTMRLVKASATQKQARDVLAHQAWGQRLTPQQFAEREERLRAHPWAAHAMETWLWMDDGGVLSSCETFCMQSRCGTDAGHTYGVASVFTEETLRGRGHAVRMLDAVMDALMLQDPHAQAAILFSDVGAPIYERCGFRATAAVDWEALAQAGPLPVDGTTLVDGKSLPLALERLRVVDDFVVVPTADQLDWHVERQRSYAALLGLEIGNTWHGALGDSGGAATWCLDVKGAELVVLTLGAAHDKELACLLAAAQRVAHRCGVERLHLWETPDLVNCVLPAGWRRKTRDGSLPMVRALHANVTAWHHVPRALWV